ncbi:MAG: CHRD domain-containing protein [Phycisphaerales bacterium]|nr:CHRD domain-containing protein [Phycisphaerales bacterium]
MRKLNRFVRRSAAGLMAVSALLAPSALAECTIFTRVAVLTGSQEVPPNPSTAIGAGRFLIDTNANTVTYRIVYNGFAETAAHIHGIAGPGVSAGVIHPLPSGGVKTGTWMYPEAMEGDILNGRTYANIHSAAFPGGEIRGQIVSAVALLDGGQEVPPAVTPALGVGLFNLNTTTNELSYYVLFNGLSAAQTASHIHGIALPGVAAGVRQPIPVGSPSTGMWVYPEADEQAIIDGRMYVNIHTTAFPGGEIRGQIVTSVNPIDGLQEVPPSPSAGAGFGLVSIDKAADMLSWDVRFQGLLGPQTAAHIHGFALPGVSAGVLNPIPNGSPSRGTWAYAAGQEAGILEGRTYFNVHTTVFGGGEIRGQINFASLLPSCPADLNCDGLVDFADYLEFLNLYDAGDLRVDYNGDGLVDFADYLEFLNFYDAGC